MNNFTFIDVATLIIAMWGAFLSSYLAIREIKKEKRKIDVSCSFTVKQAAEEDKHVLLIQTMVVNTGHRPVAISSIGFQFNIDHPNVDMNKNPMTITPASYPDENYLEKTLPKALSDGEALKIDFPCDFLLHLSNRVKGKLTAVVATDAEGKEYSSPLPKDVYDYLNYNMLEEPYKFFLDTAPSKLESK